MRLIINDIDKVKVKLTYTGAEILKGYLENKQLGYVNELVHSRCEDCGADSCYCTECISKFQNTDIEYKNMIKELNEIKTKYTESSYYESELATILDIFCGNCFYNKCSCWNLDSYIKDGEFIIEK